MYHHCVQLEHAELFQWISPGGPAAASPCGIESRRRKFRYLRAFGFCWVFKQPHRLDGWGGAGCRGGSGVGQGPRRVGLACPGQQGPGGRSGKGRTGGEGEVRHRRRAGGIPLPSRRRCRRLPVNIGYAAPGGTEPLLESKIEQLLHWHPGGAVTVCRRPTRRLSHSKMSS